MVSHDTPAGEDAGGSLTPAARQRRALQRLDDGHAELLDALAGLDDAEAFLGSRWSVWEVMQHLLAENFVAALEQIASGEREMLPAFDGRDDRIAGDIARLEANYQRFRALIAGLSEAQLNLPATPANPENNYPALSLLELIERVAGHEAAHARQVSETRKYVAAFRARERAVTVAGLGTGDPASVPVPARELLANADYVIGSDAALSAARRWVRAVELPLRPGNRAELLNRIVRDTRAGLWSMVITLGDPAESAPGLIDELRAAADAVAVIPAPGFYQLALQQVGLSPLSALCCSAERIGGAGNDIGNGIGDAGLPAAGGRAAVILGAEGAGTWQDIARRLTAQGTPVDAPAQLVTGLSDRPAAVAILLGDAPAVAAAIDAALVVYPA